MTEKEKMNKTSERAKYCIGIINSTPEDKKTLFTAIATAYIEGMEAGARVAQEMEKAAV